MAQREYRHMGRVQILLACWIYSQKAHQQKREGDIKVTGHVQEEWIIEAKGLAPTGGEHISFQEGLGQILQARHKRDLRIIYALAMPRREPFIQEATQIDDKDLQCLRLHWNWVTDNIDQVQTPHRAPFKVEIDCPSGLTCECQKRFGTFSFW